MTKDSVFKLIVPRAFRKLATRYVKEGRTPPPKGRVFVQGWRRAERRRALRSNARWQHANQVALPHRMRKVKAWIDAHTKQASA